MNATVQLLKDVNRLIFKRRSPHWQKVRNDFLAKHKACAACGSTKNLQAHHCVPFNVDPSRELDPTNLIVLCEPIGPRGCHCRRGHLGNYRKWNPNVVADAAKALADKFNRKKI